MCAYTGVVLLLEKTDIDRYNTQRFLTDKMTFDNFIFPIIDEKNALPINGREMTRRIIKNGEKLDTDVSNCISNIMPVDPDAVDDADTERRERL